MNSKTSKVSKKIRTNEIKEARRKTDPYVDIIEIEKNEYITITHGKTSLNTYCVRCHNIFPYDDFIDDTIHISLYCPACRKILKNRKKKISVSPSSSEKKLTKEDLTEINVQKTFHSRENFKKYAIKSMLERHCPGITTGNIDSNKLPEIDMFYEQMCSTFNITKDIILLQIKHILTFNAHSSHDLHPELFHGFPKKPFYGDLFSKILKFGYFISLTIYEFETIIKNKCALCGHESKDGDHNSICRINNNQDYISTNLMPCCQTCICYQRKFTTLDEMFTYFKNFL